MRVNETNPARTLDLRAGELVEVRAAEEILATLDQNGECEGVPFMPEMLQHCGKQLRVFKRADKTCDTVNWTGNRRLKRTVHLEGLRCDGSAHGDCQAGCFLFWKEAWLRRAGTETRGSGNDSAGSRMSVPGACTLETVYAKARQDAAAGTAGEEVFSCQATELPRFTTLMSAWNIGQYVRDIATGNISVRETLRSLGIELFNRMQKLRKGASYPMWLGYKGPRKVASQSTERLDLQPGDLVQIKPRDEILPTLDHRERNRGLSFDREMVRYCGGKYRVLRKVDHIINEKTGKMMKLPNDCIILDGVVCVGELHGFCPRSIYPYWRELWLKRAE